MPSSIAIEVIGFFSFFLSSTAQGATQASVCLFFLQIIFLYTWLGVLESLAFLYSYVTAVVAMNSPPLCGHDHAMRLCWNGVLSLQCLPAIKPASAGVVIPQFLSRV